MLIASVLKSGGEYKPYHVAALRDGVAKHLKAPHQFICYTDRVKEIDALGIEAVQIRNNWPGWWAKINLFEQWVGYPTVYFDLDTIICGPLDGLDVGHRFTMLRNFWRSDRVGSGVMAWNCDLSVIYDEFCRSPQGYMNEFNRPDKWGDQAFILARTPIKPEHWQTKFPGRIVSYKMHCRPGMEPHDHRPCEKPVVPKGASVIAYHGEPRPWRTPLWKAA